MGKYCIGCGKEINSEKDYCELCEAKMNGESDNIDAPNDARTAYGQAEYQNRYTYDSPVKGKDGSVPSMWVYFGLMFLFSIPFLGWIAAIIMAFAVDNKSIKNYARANVLYSIIMGIISFILAVIIMLGAKNMYHRSELKMYYDDPIFEYSEGIFDGYEDQGI